MDIIILIGRILYGGFFVLSGISHFSKNESMAGYAASKGVPFSKAAVFFSGALIILGGLGIVAGVYIKIAIALLTVFLVVVSFWMHAFWKEADPMMKMNDKISFMKNMALWGAALMFLAIAEPWIFAF